MSKANLDTMTTVVTTYTAKPDDRGWQHHSDGLLQLLLFVDSVAFDGHKGIDIGMGMDMYGHGLDSGFIGVAEDKGPKV